ncbi:hypothetical protein NC653_014641 [Populus alba x Populus x berolinensis]|uniref:Uncharacterized protein n=1 Tax=Populus alba x Populus x berolinensis TaxID=444605 RepID=A0AAD6QXL4_9ROSI|nr:hypothetical protein NC653_014641 [Populus alba x Populus x berolinensis]
MNGSAGSENGRPASSCHQGFKTRTKITDRKAASQRQKTICEQEKEKRFHSSDNSRTSNKIELRFRPYIQ